LGIVDAKQTPCSTADIYDAFADAWGELYHEEPPRKAVELLVAHSALESGWWRFCFNHNLGNIKSISHTDMYCERECGEELPMDRVPPNDSRIAIVRRYERNGIPYASIIVKPDHKWSRFRAWASFEAAAMDMLLLLHANYGASWPALLNGDAEGYARALHASHYFTADPAKYAASLTAVLSEVRRKMIPEKTWTFARNPGEPIRDCVVRCCTEALADGAMGFGLRNAWYKKFINCDMNPSGKLGDAYVADISPWTTSCALFVRAVHAWCGKKTNIAHNGIGIFSYLQLDTGSKAWKPWRTGNVPKPGDVFFVQNSGANDGHVGIFLRQIEPGFWETAEGGGSAKGAKSGTSCTISRRKLGPTFDAWRPLQGYFDCDLIEWPDAPAIVAPERVEDTHPDGIPVPPIPAEVDAPIPEAVDTSPQTPDAIKADTAPKSALAVLVGFVVAALSAAATKYTFWALAVGAVVFVLMALYLYRKHRGNV